MDRLKKMLGGIKQNLPNAKGAASFVTYIPLLALTLMVTLFAGEVRAQDVVPPVDVAGFIAGLTTSLGGVYLAVVTGFMGFLVISIAIRKARMVGQA